MAHDDPRLQLRRDSHAAVGTDAEPARALEPHLSGSGALAVSLDARPRAAAAAAGRKPRRAARAEVGRTPAVGLLGLLLAVRLSGGPPAARMGGGDARAQRRADVRVLGSWHDADPLDVRPVARRGDVGAVGARRLPARLRLDDGALLGLERPGASRAERVPRRASVRA